MRRTRRPWLAPSSSRDEKGFVIVWMAVVLVLLLSVAAFAVDLVHAYVEAERAQNAADAAALAASTLVPNDRTLCAAPSTRAAELAGDNGFVNNVDGAVVQSSCSGANEMTVTVGSTFDTFFARIMGFDKLTVKRTGVADYDAPIQMGSAANYVGSVPVCPAPFTTPATCVNQPSLVNSFLWATIQGASGSSQNGDAVTNHNCGSTTDECTGGVNNLENSAGEAFQVHNGTAHQTLSIYVYDAGFVATQQTCTSGLVDHTDADKPPAHKYGENGRPDITSNYSNSAYCTGDLTFNPGDAAPPTTYAVYTPSGASQTGCVGRSDMTIPGKGIDQNPPQASFEDPADRAYDDVSARAYFHQWWLACSITDADAGDYTVRVTTGPGKGSNQFSILGLGSTESASINVSSRETLPLGAFNNSGSGESKFYLARVFPSDRPRKLELSFFDLGDNSNSSVNANSQGWLYLTTTGVSTSFDTNLATTGRCRYTPPPLTTAGSRKLDAITSFSNMTTKPAMLPSTPAQPCAVRYDSAFNPVGPNTWDGRWVKVDVDLPPRSASDGYNCDASQYTNCWIMLNIAPDAGQLTDVTTWKAQIQGGPVRLVG